MTWDLSVSLSGDCRVNLANPTRASIVPAAAWEQFVGNVGFLRQQSGLGRLDLNDWRT